MAYPPKPIKRNTLCFDIFIMTIFYLCFIVIRCTLEDSDTTKGFSLVFIRGYITFILHRIILILRELIINKFRHPDVIKLVLWIIKMDNWVYFVAFTILITYILFVDIERKKDVFVEMDRTDWMTMFLYIMGLYFRWGDCPLTESYRLEDTSKFGGGASQAYGFYYGYLKMILGDGSFSKSITAFINKENIRTEQMPERKLFILIPSSSKITNEIRNTDPNDETIEHVPNATLSVSHNRCMVVNRRYKCSMYALRYNGKKCYYLPFEGATPLKTFYETCEHNPHLKEFNREVVSSFYHTLAALIDKDFEMKPFIELVYYDDTKYPNIDEVLIQRIKYLKRQRKLKKC